MNTNLIYVILLSIFLFGCRTELETPLEKNNFKELTSHSDLLDFTRKTAEASDLILMDTLGLSVEEKLIPYLLITNREIRSSEKVRVLIFAQQHGNEQAGKEGALLFLKSVIEGEFDYLFDKIELVLIPQMNPDGSDKDKRRNGNDFDLNRDHLILSQPETVALHKLYSRFKPHVVLDVHEYRPFSRSWREYGYLKNFDIQFGTLTNPNISGGLLNIQKSEFIPYIKKYLEEKGYSFNEYIVGGPPEVNRIRYSTVDINDGRQSFGIQHSLSFILEGKNGRDSKSNLKHRTFSQAAALNGFLQFVADNSAEIRSEVENAKLELIDSGENENIAIRIERVSNGEKLKLNLRSLATGNDTLITVEKFHPANEIQLSVEKPIAYLIEKSQTAILDILEKHSVKILEFTPSEDLKIYGYKFVETNEVINEELKNYFPEVKKVPVEIKSPHNYYIVPTNQTSSNLLVTALEPQSMLGLIQYGQFFPTLDFNLFPIYRVELKN